MKHVVGAALSNKMQKSVVVGTVLSNKMQKSVVVGTVLSNKMKKSVVVVADRLFLNQLYNRYVKRTIKYMAHDENCSCNIGLIHKPQCRMSKCNVNESPSPSVVNIAEKA